MTRSVQIFRLIRFQDHNFSSLYSSASNVELENELDTCRRQARRFRDAAIIRLYVTVRGLLGGVHTCDLNIVIQLYPVEKAVRLNTLGMDFYVSLDIVS